MGEVRELTIEAQQLATKRDLFIARATALIDRQQLVRKQFIEDEVKLRVDALEAWASENRAAEFAGLKSLNIDHGSLGWRVDSPSLVLLNRSWTWTKVLEEIKAKKWRRFLRVSVDVNKQAILQRCGTVDSPKPFQQKQLPALGLKVKQDENFFVDPNMTPVVTRQVKEAV